MASTCDLIVVGAGVGGLSAALTAADAGLSVVVVHKGPRWRADRPNQETATCYAQGGIAVADNDDDSVDLHVADTVAAGAGLTDTSVARDILAAGPSAVRTLINRGVHFDIATDGALARTREGGHSRRRILHAGGDATGAEIQRGLGRAALSHPRIALVDDATVSEVLVDDGTAIGVAYLRGGRYVTLYAPSTVLATGGSGQLYAATTNPFGATGDGLALALRAGAHVADVEFIQFHPTMLYTPGARGRRVLISEAVRGEGGRLVDAGGRSVTADIHPLGDLAPRDVVANAIRRALDTAGSPCVYLDIRDITDFAARFPTVTAGVRAAGVDIADGRIPVVPGAHYQCGGVVTDGSGRTSISGLLAVGEVARTGLHGANRLASNSLLEAAVVGTRAGGVSVQRRAEPAPVVRRLGDLGPSVPQLAPIVPRTELQNMMTRYAGLVRDASGLEAAGQHIANAEPRILTTAAEVEDAALTVAAGVVLAAARQRSETLGPHVRGDSFRDDRRGLSRHFALVDGVPSEVPEQYLQSANLVE